MNWCSQERLALSSLLISLFVCLYFSSESCILFQNQQCRIKPKTSWLIGQLKWAILKYSGTPLNRPPLGHKILEVNNEVFKIINDWVRLGGRNMVVITMWSYKRGGREFAAFRSEGVGEGWACWNWLSLISIILGNKIILSALHLVGRYMSFGQITPYSPSSFIFPSPPGADPKNTVKGVGGGRDSFQLHRYYLFYWEVFKNAKFYRKGGEAITSTNLKLS